MFIEASSKYAKVTDSLNDFIDRLNRIKSAELDNLTDAQIDSIFYIAPKEVDYFDLEWNREGLRHFIVNKHFQSTNVFRIGELPQVDGAWPRVVNAHKVIDYPGDEVKSILIGQAIYYIRKNYLERSCLYNLLENRKPEIPPSNFDPHLHAYPDAERFIWVPRDKWEFIYHNGQWKVAILYRSRI